MIDVVVLLGAPGSGKSTVGATLATRGFRWREWEPAILERWGSREAFIASKAVALPALHEEVMRWIATDGPPAVLETTGLSDAPLLASLVESGRACIVRLDVSEEEALRRIAVRPRGRHLSDDVDANRVVWHAFREHVIPATHADLVIDTDSQSVISIVAAIVAAVDAPR